MRVARRIVERGVGMSAESDQETEGREEEKSEGREESNGGEQSEADKAKEAQDRHEQAQEKMKELEEQDEPPTDLSEWPDDEAKYVTYGGSEGDHSYDEGPEKKLGPSSLERHEDGSITIEGEEVDDPDEHKAEPIPGGPTDPNSPELAGEKKKKEKQEGEGSGQGESSGDGDDDEKDSDED
jgi:hypothetical protein